MQTGPGFRGELEGRFHRVLDTYGSALGRVAGSYTRVSHEREDLLQEIAIAIWRALPAFRGECSERTFVFRIAHNRGMSYLARRRSSLVGHAGDEELDVADAAPGPEATLSAREQTRRLRDAVGRLPLQFRQVITLALEGLSYSDIGQVLGLSESNVGVRLTRARHMLRQLIYESEGTSSARPAATARVVVR